MHYESFKIPHRMKSFLGMDLNRKEKEDLSSLGWKEKRFLHFSSLEFEGHVFMTPADFLQSLVQHEPLMRCQKRKLTLEDVKEIQESTPNTQDTDDTLFRGLGNQGLISFTDYLILLGFLFKPTHSFSIWFNMLDLDSSGAIQMNEFKALKSVFRSSRSQEEMADIVNYGLDDIPEIKTTLQLLLYGNREDSDLLSSKFYKFLHNLHTEVLKMEFEEFAKGSSTISEFDFARILLRHTFYDEEELVEVLDTIQGCLQCNGGFTFEEFEDFHFVSSYLLDFQAMMNILHTSGRTLKKEEFQRLSYACSDRQLSPHMLEVVFQMFNRGEGLVDIWKLEMVVKNWLRRGTTHTDLSYWPRFKQCMHREMRTWLR